MKPIIIILYIAILFTTYQLKAQPYLKGKDLVFEQYKAKIDAVNKAKKLQKLNVLADEVEVTFKQDKALYVALLCEICKAYSSGGYDEREAYTQLRKQLYNALQYGKETPIEIHIELLRLLIFLEEVQTTSSDTKKCISYVLIGMDNLYSRIDKKWDKNDLPLINIYPDYQAMNSKDKKIKAAAIKDYKKRVALNTQKTLHTNEQTYLNNYKISFTNICKAFLEKAAIDKTSLTKLIDANITDSSLKQVLLNKNFKQKQ